MAGDLDDFVPYLLRRISARIDDAIAGELRERGLNREQWRVLMVIRQFGPQTLSALSDRVSIKTSTLSRQVDRMIADGLVTRTASGEGRAVSIDATDLGRKRLVEAEPMFHELQGIAATAFAPDELERLKVDLRRLYKAYAEFAESGQ